MANKPLKSRPSSKGPAAPEAPATALERPQRLKKWSSDLIEILKTQENAIFDGYTFEENRLTRVDFTRILRKISGCGSVVELRAAISRNTGEIGPAVVHAANFCGQHTICPYCAGRVQDRRGAKWRKPIEWAARTFRHAYMVTATTAPDPTWRGDLAGLRKAWRGFQLMGQKGRGGEWSKVRAGLAKMELKRGSASGLPHCHYHAILFTDEPLNYRVWSREEKKKPKHERRSLFEIPWKGGHVAASKLSLEWFLASGGTSIDLDVKPMAGSPESIYQQCREVLKYATKFDSAPQKNQEKLFAADFLAIKEATFQRRLFHTYGAFRVDRDNPEKACPYLVDQDDFTGGGPHIKDGPAIYEARWREKSYSPLSVRDRPVFRGSDKSINNQFRWTMLNRCQGRARRIRSAVLKARDRFAETGCLSPAQYEHVSYNAKWEEKREWRLLEIPGDVAAAPGNYATWEQWINDLTDVAAGQYRAVREAADLEIDERMNGTLEDRQLEAARVRQAYFNSDECKEKAWSAIRAVLNSPGKMITGPP